MTTLQETLTGLTRPGDLYTAADGRGGVVCNACGHHCHIPPGKSGTCWMRHNVDGTLQVPFGYASGLACDPIEKKPFFHLLPGQDALSFGMLGCNFHCPFCQNWVTSQALRDPNAVTGVRHIRPEEIIGLAARAKARIIASTYNEPLITTEWAVDIFRLARERGMLTAYVSNGFASPEVIDYLDPWLDAINIDLKCFTEAGYAWLGGHLEPVKEAIRAFWDRGKWVEVITLVVPGFNDTTDELTGIAEFLASVSPDLPWHVTAYHASYKMMDGSRSTPPAKLAEALAIGRQVGLRYVYAGNIRGMPGAEDTHCHKCHAALVKRSGFVTLRDRVVNGTCPDCGTPVPGIWQ